ncbi:hypothetical protein [Streptomyces sp. NPDC046685]|uniref:hypothetical protein n=1 Tax=Streptomyces sp. NPDC046685 TaxID=3157202 RepID=UPI00340F7903
MNEAATEDDLQLLATRAPAMSAVFDHEQKAAHARALALSFLAELVTVHGLPVSEQVTDAVHWW